MFYNPQFRRSDFLLKVNSEAPDCNFGTFVRFINLSAQKKQDDTLYICYMKNRILLLALVFLSLPVFAQQKNSFFSINGGAAIPVGNFKAQNLNKGSFALPGIYIGAEGAWYFKEHFGIGGEFGLEYNNINAAAEATAKVNADPFLTALTIRAEAFQIFHGAVGLYTHWKLMHHLSATAKVLGGMIWGRTPYELDKPTYFGAGPDYYEITSSKDHQYFVEPGLGLQYRFNQSVGLSFNAEYLTRKLYFGYYNADGSSKVEDKQINLINTSLGLVIYL